MINNENFVQVGIEKEMKKSYLDYAMSVIIGRALPDIRDGLKPVHRRILYAMKELKNDWNKPYKKSARVVGDVIGKYHPHGDAAVYDALVRMAQDFSLRYPMIDGQGNFGSVDGDSPAAMRYTEARMKRLAHLMIDDLEKETVDFVVNYDESLSEPSILPAKLPAFLINGSSGIAVGMTTNVPPHNLTEVVSGIKALIDNPELTIEDIIRIIPGPDFPTAGIIHGRKGIYDAYKTGRGIIKLRCHIVVEKDKNGDRETIVVKEIPYQVNKAVLIEKIAALVKNKHIEGIKYVRDESDRDGMRIAIALKKGNIPEIVINQLYKHTRMSLSFGIIMLAIVNGKPELLNLKKILQLFIEHRKDIITKRTKYELKKAEARAHILEGLKTALDNLDEIVALIRGSNTPAEAKAGIINNFSLTPIQAQAILDMKLQRLTGLEREKLIREYEEIIKQIAIYQEILANEHVVLNMIKEDLDEIVTEFGDERRTRIVDEAKEITIEDMIKEEDMVVTISQTGYIKRAALTTYRTQNRGGKGKTAMGTKKEDFVRDIFIASTHHTFLFFTNFGKVYWRKVYDIPEVGRTAKGYAIVNLLNLAEGEKLATVLAVPSFEQGNYLMMATKKGLVKKTDMMAYANPRVNGIIALRLNPEDELISALVTNGEMNIFLTSLLGKTIQFKETDIRPTGRVSAGVIGMKFLKTDRIIGMETADAGKTLFTITENGFGKRTEVSEYPLQKRGGKGVITIKTSERNGKVVSALLVDNKDNLVLIANSGKLIRISVKEISTISRNTQGVKIMNTNYQKDEKIVSVAKVAEEE
ncbi:MAG: DNA gyrase subunit A [Deltaproteobacteria bacterium]|nr:DNA gyrase subunit A [Deltaproteobacteria bacterium]